MGGGKERGMSEVTRLVAQQLLSGKVQNITAMDFRESPGEFLTQVQMGATFNITKYGQPIATLTAYQPNAFELGAEARRVEKRKKP